jgi:hypothetical protein
VIRCWRPRSSSKSKKCRNICNKRCGEGFDAAPDIAVDLSSPITPVTWETDGCDGDDEEADREKGYELETPDYDLLAMHNNFA